MSDKFKKHRKDFTPKPDRGPRPQRAGGKPGFRGGHGRNDNDGPVRIYGLHSVRAVLDNPRRVIKRLLATRNALLRLEIAEGQTFRFPVETVEPRIIDKMLGPDAVHQGAVIEAEPLEAKPLTDLGETRLVVVLDEVTDPHNVGAIMRSAVAFKAGALITTSRNSPNETGVLAKSASGALEFIDLIEVKNLSHALDELEFQGFQTVGLDSEGPAILEETYTGDKIALVLGSEGKGLRQKTRQTVKALARLDMPGEIRSLNVSNAAALAFYTAHVHLTRKA